MNIAVAKGAPEGLSFIKYVEYLSENNYVPPDGKEWVDHIRKKETKLLMRYQVLQRMTPKSLSHL